MIPLHYPAPFSTGLQSAPKAFEFIDFWLGAFSPLPCKGHSRPSAPPAPTGLLEIAVNTRRAEREREKELLVPCAGRAWDLQLKLQSSKVLPEIKPARASPNNLATRRGMRCQCVGREETKAAFYTHPAKPGEGFHQLAVGSASLPAVLPPLLSIFSRQLR